MSELVATIIAAPGEELSPALIQKIIQPHASRNPRIEWLAEKEAVDIFLPGEGANTWRLALTDTIGTQPVDFILQPSANRRKKFLAADMESTIIEQELLDELADEVGARDKVAAITKRAMNGEIDFPSALRERMALLKGNPVSMLEAAVKRISYTPGAETLVATMKKHGAQAWLITGGFSYFAAPVAVDLGFDQCYANELIVKDNLITGEAGEPILDRNRKKALVEQACRELKLTAADCLAVGDGANDVPMLDHCNRHDGLGIAYCAKPKVRAAVPHHINYADLTALLYAQGYKKNEFAA